MAYKFLNAVRYYNKINQISDNFIFCNILERLENSPSSHYNTINPSLFFYLYSCVINCSAVEVAVLH